MMNMLSFCLLISVLFQVLVPLSFFPAAYADFAGDYPGWKSEYIQLSLLADGADSGMVKGIRPGQFIRLSDNTDTFIAYNGQNSSGFTVSEVDRCYSEEGYRLEGIGPGFSVEVYPAPEAVSCQDAEFFRWIDVFHACDITAEEESFSVSPSVALDGSYNGSVSVSPEVAGDCVYHLELKTGTGELLTGENSVGGLAPGDYKVRVAAEKNILASEWYEFTVEGPAKYQITVEDIPEEKGSVEAYYVVPGAESSRVPLSSGSEIYEGVTVYVSVTAAENYKLDGIVLTPDGGTSESLLPQEAENGFFSFVMPASPVHISAVISAVQEPDPPSGEETEDDPPDDERDEEETPDEEPDGSNPITAVIFERKEDTISLFEGEKLYSYTVLPEDPDGTLHWSRTFREVADIIIDPEQRLISVTPRKAGSFTLSVVVKENQGISDSLTVTVIDDRTGNPENPDSFCFTYASEERMWFYDHPGDFSLRCSGPASMLEKILVDGQTIPRYHSGHLNWSLSDTNDTAVNFSREFMSSLPHGEHLFKFVYTNGASVPIGVSIQSRYSNPKTGDEQNPVFCCALLSFSALMAAGMLVKIRKGKTVTIPLKKCIMQYIKMG